jgi:hypothetical protein
MLPTEAGGATKGTRGSAPMERVARERRYVARALSASQAAGPTRIPRGAGAPLPSTVRAQMEPKLDAEADALAIEPKVRALW